MLCRPRPRLALFDHVADFSAILTVAEATLLDIIALLLFVVTRSMFVSCLAGVVIVLSLGFVPEVVDQRPSRPVKSENAFVATQNHSDYRSKLPSYPNSA